MARRGGPLVEAGIAATPHGHLTIAPILIRQPRDHVKAIVVVVGQWIENHRPIADKWPVNVVYARLTEMLKDGILSSDEQVELLETLRDLTGDTTLFQEANKSTTLPVDRPAPEVEFTDKSFCLTGKFVFGSTVDCEEAMH